MRVGRSGGMLNGISTSSRPAVPTRWTRWSSSSCVEHVNVACRPPKSSTADVRTSVPNRSVAAHGRDDVVRFAVEHPAGHVDRVAADVHQRAAAVGGDVADVVGIDVAVREERLDRQQLTDGAGVDERPDPLPQRVEPVHERLHQQHAGARAQPSTISPASAALIASGFSHSTCLPAAAARSVHSAWRWLGSGMYTASTSASASSSSYEP